MDQNDQKFFPKEKVNTRKSREHADPSNLACISLSADKFWGLRAAWDRRENKDQRMDTWWKGHGGKNRYRLKQSGRKGMEGALRRYNRTEQNRQNTNPPETLEKKNNKKGRGIVQMC
jgi:hypothetical protein